MACKKIRFSDKRQAKLYCRTNNVRARKAYKCATCDGWHITSMDAKSMARVENLIARFRPGQVWRSKRGGIEFEVVQPPSNGDGLKDLLQDFYLIEE